MVNGKEGNGSDKYPKRFAITAVQGAQNPSNASKYGQNSKAGAPHKEFLGCLDRYCKAGNAEEIIQAIQGSYVGEIELAKYFRDRCQTKEDVYMETARLRRLFSQRRREENIRKKNPEYRHYFWDEIPFVRYDPLNFKRLNTKIGIIEVQDPSQNEDPITGNKDIPQDYLGMSVVMPHTKQRLVAVPKDLGGKFPRLELSTGVCTHPNYNETNHVGKKAKRHHQYGFCAVDILDERTYLPRLVPARTDGTFIDFGVEYRPGKVPRRASTAALVLGDMHIPFNDPDSTKASFEMIKYFKPREVFIHDLLDFNSINHFMWDDTVYRMLLAEKSKEIGFEFDYLEAELKAGLDFLNELAEVAKHSVINIVASNHDMFLYKWITTDRHLKDPKNSRLGSLIRGHFYEHDSPLERGLEQIGKIPSNVKFLSLTDDERPWGYECASHGHLGINGAAGNSLKSFKVSYGKGIKGHSHSLEVNGHAISVGTNSIIPLDYQRGSPSGSLHGNAIIYDGDLSQALPIIHEKWIPPEILDRWGKKNIHSNLEELSEE